MSRRIVPVYRRGAEVDVVCQYLERGSRIATVGGAEILLTPRQQVPHRTQRLITAECPGCGGQFRHLYLVGEGGPKCRRCHGLIYASQARSQVARFRRRSELARQWRSWDRIRPIPYHWMNRFTTEGILLERRRELRESRAICKELESRRTAEERERASERQEARKKARAAWRQYMHGLDSRRLKDRARLFRRTLRLLARKAYPDSHPYREVLLAGARGLAVLLPDFPSEVLEFDLKREPSQ